jgi:isopenicillin N synthase-like dioxygenase
MAGIPLLDAAPLFGTEPAARALTDRALFTAARDMGFLCLTGLPADIPLGRVARAGLLTIFTLDEADKRCLYRHKFAPENPNRYRGWFPVQPGNLTSKEGMDLGCDVAYGPQVTVGGDPLREATPLPEESRLPGWRAAIARYYRSMERVCQALMHSLARSLGLADGHFDDAFDRGLSTLRLIRYPPRSAAELATLSDPTFWAEEPSNSRYLVGAPHTDSGFVTILAQDEIAGLEVRGRDGRWVPVPPREATLVVNFGQVLEQWSAGRIRATEHRVVGTGLERYSIPFFYEARADARIAPLPIDPPDLFTPFQYGDFLWQRITSFVEFRGMEGERPPGSTKGAGI